MTRFALCHRDDRGVVALELVLVMPIIVALLVCSVTLAGLFLAFVTWLAVTVRHRSSSTSRGAPTMASDDGRAD